jgi:protein-tyrosine phosphatase
LLRLGSFVVATVLFVCTGNLCRSPSAARFLRRALREHGRDDVLVQSAGTMDVDLAVPEPLVEEALSFGIDLSRHVPHRLRAAWVDEADLVVGMAREHVRDLMLMDPTWLARSFTLREIVRRGGVCGPRPSTEDLGSWLERVGEGRHVSDVIGRSTIDDVEDPMGGTADDYQAMLDAVSVLTGQLRELAWPDDPAR